MNANVRHIAQSMSRRVLVPVLALALALVATPVLAQDGGSQAKVEELKKTFAAAMNAAKQGNADEAYPKLEQSLQLANEAEQSGAASQIQDRMITLAKNWGNKALKDKNYAAAETHFNKGAQYAPDDAYMVYGMGLAQINQDGKTADAIQTLQQAISVAEENGDRKTAQLATERIRQEFVSRASQALNVQNPGPSAAQEALTALDEMREYVDASAKSLFYRATALYAQGDHPAAISTAREGLEMHRGSRTSAAKYHFVIAESQLQNGDKEAACAEFEQAAFGDYKARSEHYLENECN
ncbi:tetratricopeptide repeat protein [Longibacter sp.]|uniref:tetratricopeptide repeat protein n=1 Tax=Longibacter sp. TaxID=2045415 RepID=UPI003EBED4CF